MRGLRCCGAAARASAGAGAGPALVGPAGDVALAQAAVALRGAGSPTTTWSEVSEHVLPRASLTERARREACRLVGEDGLDVAAIAVTLGVGWHTVMRAVPDYGRLLIEDLRRTAGVAAVGVDETAFLAARAGAHTQFVTSIVALPGPGRPRAQLLDVVPGRTVSVVQQWISAQDAAWRERVVTASLDPFRGYGTALRTSLPDAVRVLDAFHVVRLEQAAVDDVRRRRQQETLGRRGHRDDPLYRGRRLLRRGFTMLNQRQWTRLELTLSLGDPSGQLTSAWMVAQELQLLYARSHDLTDARRRPWRILDHCARSDVPRAAAPGPHARRLDRGATRLLDAHRPTGRQQRTDRSHQRPDQESEASRPRFPQLRQLPAPATPIRSRSPRLVA